MRFLSSIGTIPLLQVEALETYCRVNIGVARVAGMATELKMVGNNSYSIALLVFFPGYIIISFFMNYGG